MSNYIKINCDYWSQAIYDNPHPESYVFRIYGRVIKHQFGFDGSKNTKLLDFGCGSGGNSHFFAKKGFDVHGVDQSKVDIESCKERIPNLSINFKVISPICLPTDDWFDNRKFEMIVSFQALYYLNDIDLENRLTSLYNALLPGGIFIATMMHVSSWYYTMSKPATNGMHFVRFYREQDIGRPGLTLNDHYINFTKDEEDLKSKFSLFTPIHTKGYYDGVYRDDQGSEKHLVLIGQKN